MGFVDLGSAVAKGMQGYQAGVDTNAKLKALQQQQTLKTMQMEQQLDQGDVQTKQMQARFDMLNMQVNDMHKNIAKKDTFESLKMYSYDKDKRHLNNLLQKSPLLQKAFGDTVRVDDLSEADIKQLGTTLSPEKAAILKANPMRFVKTIDKTGNVSIVDMNEVYAKTGYAEFAQAHQLDLLKKRMSIRLPGVGDRPTAAVQDNRYKADLYRKEAEGTLNIMEKYELDQLKRNRSVYDKQIDAGSNFVQMAGNIKGLMNKGKLIPNELLQDAYNKSNAVKGSKMAQGTITEIAGLSSFVKQATKIYNDIYNLDTKIFSRGLKSDFTSKVVETLNDAEFRALPKEQQKNIIAKISTADSPLANLISLYLKNVSGSAVAEQEYDRIVKILTGGQHTDKSLLLASLKGFINSVKSNVISNTKTYAMFDPYSTAVLYNNLMSTKLPEIATEQIPMTKPTMKQKVLSVANKITKPLGVSLPVSPNGVITSAKDKYNKFKVDLNTSVNNVKTTVNNATTQTVAKARAKIKDIKNLTKADLKELDDLLEIK